VVLLTETPLCHIGAEGLLNYFCNELRCPPSSWGMLLRMNRAISLVGGGEGGALLYEPLKETNPGGAGALFDP